MQPNGRRIEVTSLSSNTHRYLSNHLLGEIKTHRWKKHSRALSALPRFHIVGGGGVSKPQPASEFINKYVSVITQPEERLGIHEMFALLMPWDAYQRFFAVDMDREGLWWGWIGLLSGSARKAWHLKRPDAEHPQPRMARNARKGVTEEGALACEQLLYYADVVKLSAKAQDEYLEFIENERAKRLPDLVIPIIEAALERPHLPKAA